MNNGPISIRNIYQLFGENTPIFYNRMFFYENINKMPDNMMDTKVHIANVIARYDGDMVIGSFIACFLTNDSHDCDMSTLSSIVDILPVDDSDIVVNRVKYLDDASGIKTTTNGLYKPIIDHYGDEQLNSDTHVVATCNLGVEITYTPYKKIE